MPFQQEITLTDYPILGEGLKVSGIATLEPDDDGSMYLKSVTLDEGWTLPGKQVSYLSVREWLFCRILVAIENDKDIHAAFHAEYEDWKHGDLT